MKTFDFIENNRPIFEGKSPVSPFVGYTYTISAFTGVLVGFLLLEKKQNISYSFTGAVENFFKWIHQAHTNSHVLYISPIVFLLLTLLVFRFIDYTKTPKPEQPKAIDKED